MLTSKEYTGRHAFNVLSTGVQSVGFQFMPTMQNFTCCIEDKEYRLHVLHTTEQILCVVLEYITSIC